MTGVAGKFQRGDTVRVLDEKGLEIARGLTAYSVKDAERIIGHNSREIEALLGYRGREELVHRDDLVLVGPRRKTKKAQKTRKARGAKG